MSIMESDQTEIIKLGTVHAWVFKISLWVMPVFSVWMVNTVLTHDRDIAVIKMQLAMQSSGKVTQSVNVGQAKGEVEEQMTSAKTWLTTKDVAQREGITERTVLNYIEHGMILPSPRKNGKSWEIAEHFRIVPQNSDDCGNGENLAQGP